MSIKDMPHVTVEQVLALREAAIEIEQELVELKAILPKVRADAVRSAVEDYKNEYVGQGVVALLESFADKLETDK